MSIVYRSAEAPHPVLAADEVRRLPAETAERLKAAGLLRPGELARAVGCEACEHDHAEWVEESTAPDGGRHFHIQCLEKGRVEVSRERLQRWLVDFAPLAEALHDGLGACGPVEALRPGRLWRLGRAVLGGERRELWMARDAASVRGPDLIASIPRASGAVLFRLGDRPLGADEAAGFEAVFDVRALVSLTEAGLVVDRGAVERRLARRRRCAPRKESRVWECLTLAGCGA